MKGQLVQRNEAPELYDFAVKNNLIKSETDWQEQKLYGFFSSGDNEETQHTLGKPLDPALPNIKGTIGNRIGFNHNDTGAFKYNGWRGCGRHQSGDQTWQGSINFNASWVSAIYRDETNTVQTPDIPENWVIKYKS